MKHFFHATLLMLLTIAGCQHQAPPAAPALVAQPHYVLGNPYQAGGHWYYPAENYGLDTSGIASVLGSETGLTADGELKDPQALTAAMQTIQLPAIVQVTNLENGRQILVRVNDRGPASPGRIIALSARAALFLQIPSYGAARVHVKIDNVMSRQVVEQIGGGPRLAIATAARASITAEALPPPGGGQAGPARSIGATEAQQSGPVVPERLPERITQVYADPGTLYLDCGSFGRFNYAHVVQAKLAGLGASVLTMRDGRQTSYAVRVGPLASIAQADRALAQALAAGVIDARITIQ